MTIPGNSGETLLDYRQQADFPQIFEIELFRKHERTGRPLGMDSFIEKMERLLGRKLKPEKPGPKKKDK